MGAEHVKQLGPRARVVRRLLIQPYVVVGAVRLLRDVTDRVVEGRRVGAPSRLPRLRSERGGEVQVAAAVERAHVDVGVTVVGDARAVGRPGGAVLADGGGIRDVHRGRPGRRQIERVDVEDTARAVGKRDLRAVRRPGRVAVLQRQPRGERGAHGPATCAADHGAQEELRVAERGAADEDDPPVRARQHRAGSRRECEHRGECESDAQPAAHHLANLTRGGAQKRA